MINLPILKNPVRHSAPRIYFSLRLRHDDKRREMKVKMLEKYNTKHNHYKTQWRHTKIIFEKYSQTTFNFILIAIIIIIIKKDKIIFFQNVF